MTPIHDILRRLGGPSRLGRLLGISPQAISLWGSRGQIPLKHIPTLVGLAKAKGIDLSAYEMRPGIPWYTLQ